MRRSLSRLISLLGCLASLACFSRTADAQGGADLSGITQFWRVADVLQGGGEPAVAMWDSLFATPGYAALEAREHRRAAITAGMRAALSPNARALRDSLLGANGWAARVVRHVESLPARRGALDALAQVMARDDVVARAVARAATLLPEGSDARFGRPAVAFVFFLPDGRGYPGLIVADLANVSAKPDPVPFFAHEATHFYWAALSRARPGVARGAGPERLEELLMKIAEESAGDQLDKVDAATLDSAAVRARYPDASWSEYLLGYKAELAHAPEQLRLLDEAIVRMGAQPDRMREIADSAATALPMEGRPLGMYMARAIRRALGDRGFAAIAGDPVGYVRAYQEAASRPGCGCIALSAAAMRVVDELRAR